MSEKSSYRIGGPARYFFEAPDLKGLKKALAEAEKTELPIFILGSGTNVLFSDRGFDGLIIKPLFADLKADGNMVTAGAGVLMSDLLNFAAENGLSGLEWAGGLPGTLGGAIRGNAGAFGGEIKDAAQSVVSLNITSSPFKLIKRNLDECGFEYRSSIFKKIGSAEIIISSVLKLAVGDRRAIKNSIEEKIRYRAERHPLEYPNIGSIFKNVPLTRISADIKRINADSIRVNQRGSRRLSFTAPVKNDPFPVVSAAYLISEAGLKAVSLGGAMISPKHPNFIVNVLNASANDVKGLIGLARAKVRNKFQIYLEEEVIIL